MPYWAPEGLDGGRRPQAAGCPDRRPSPRRNLSLDWVGLPHRDRAAGPRPGRRALHPQRGVPGPLGRTQRPLPPHRRQELPPPAGRGHHRDVRGYGAPRRPPDRSSSRVRRTRTRRHRMRSTSWPARPRRQTRYQPCRSRKMPDPRATLQPEIAKNKATLEAQVGRRRPLSPGPRRTLAHRADALLPTTSTRPVEGAGTSPIWGRRVEEGERTGRNRGGIGEARERTSVRRVP